ncbi:GerAB/ArcD/ProY family transporter [Metabacillus iocasae]|uniref:Spore germination protein KB n=1 Tax=Priestia iocasae TaxID=2291674 RepID=A0ABS2QSI3_9BACI|nr:endospore germination permease [Metabacillus iocasae]MBM7702350.1 spore germination protein KB [Metabacillus iocasae]
MKKLNVSLVQLCTLMLLFLTGSTIVVGLNFSAQQDSLLAMLIDLVIGLIVFYGYIFIVQKSDWKGFADLLKMAFGSFLAKWVGVLYSLYFIYLAGRVTIDFAYFISQILHQNSPVWVIAISFLFVVVYCLMLGFEAVARSSEVMVFFFLLLIVILWGLGFFSEEFELKYLGPLFTQGWKKLGDMIFPTGITFPYGELVAFIVLLPSVRDREKMKQVVWLPLVISAFIIIVTMELIIGILHTPFASFYFFPFVKAMELVSYLDLIEHLEIFTTLLLLSGGFVKVTVFLYAAQVTFNQLFHIKRRIWHPIVFVAVMLFLSLFRSQNLVEHLFVGLKQVPYYLHLPFQFIIPFVLGVLVFWKARGKKSKMHM